MIAYNESLAALSVHMIGNCNFFRNRPIFSSEPIVIFLILCYTLKGQIEDDFGLTLWNENQTVRRT